MTRALATPNADPFHPDGARIDRIRAERLTWLDRAHRQLVAFDREILELGSKGRHASAARVALERAELAGPIEIEEGAKVYA